VSELAPRALNVVRTLRRRRRLLELSQRELAARAGIGEKHLGEIERGLRDPRLSTLIRLLDALDLPHDELAAFWEEALAPAPPRPGLRR
jgi:transcriptional regulator with XRE-family HTH domain